VRGVLYAVWLGSIVWFAWQIVGPPARR
jgi:hypothetical protein